MSGDVQQLYASIFKLASQSAEVAVTKEAALGTLGKSLLYGGLGLGAGAAGVGGVMLHDKMQEKARQEGYDAAVREAAELLAAQQERYAVDENPYGYAPGYGYGGY